MQIPRDLVATALGVSADQLPAGDLPSARLAARLLGFLTDSLEAESSTEPHPEAWTFLLYGELVAQRPELALEVTQQMSAQISTPDEAALIASGPLDELLNSKAAPQLLDQLKAAAKASPRFAYIMAAVAPEGSSGTLFWKAVQSMTEGAPSLDDGDPLPEA